MTQQAKASQFAAQDLQVLQRVQSLFAQGSQAYKAGRAVDAEALFQQVLDLAPSHGDTLHILGVLAQQRGAHERSADLLRRASAASPHDAAVWYNLATALRELGDADGELAALRKAVALKPSYAEAHNNLGMAFERRGRNREALESYRQALIHAPRFHGAHHNLGNVLRTLGRPDEALAAYDQCLALNPRYGEAHNGRGLALLALNRPPEAAAAFQNAINCDPADARFHGNGADALQRLGRYEEAAGAYRHALTLDPSLAVASNNLGVTLVRLGRRDEADAAFLHALALQPDQPEVYVNAAGTLEENGRLDEAFAAVAKALALDPHQAKAWRLLSQLKRFTADDPDLLNMQRLAGMIDARGASAQDQDQAELNYALGKALLDAGEDAAALAHLDRGAAQVRATISYDPDFEARAVDRLIETFDAAALQRLAGAGEASDLPVLVVGMPRSGTSLVEQILASHPKAHGAGELTLLEELATLPEPAGLGMSYPPDGRALTAGQAAELGRRYVRRLAERAPGKARVVDKLPGNFHLAGLAHMAMPNARIIHCRRDPLDTCLSCYQTLFTESQPFTYDLGELGRYYRGYERLMDHWRALLPADRFIEVDYEAVVEDVEGQARRLVAFLGLDWDEACLRFHQTRRTVRTASAGQVRQPIYSSSLGRGRRLAQQLGPRLGLDSAPGASATTS